MIRFIGDAIIDNAGSDLPVCSNRIATAFPRNGVIITVPGIHATQTMAYIREVEKERPPGELGPMTDQERDELRECAVPLTIVGENVVIRPSSDQMDLAFATDELLQQILPRNRIKFECANSPGVRQAIIRRGEAWRIQPLPRSLEEIRRLILNSPIAVEGQPIYFYCTVTGTRILTFAKFAGLAQMTREDLRLHMNEIARLAESKNAGGHPELVLFKTTTGLTAKNLLPVNPETLDETALRKAHSDATLRFEAATASELRNDDLEDGCWRNQMYRSLIAESDDTLAEEELLGLDKEYYMQIQWLPGARIEDEQLIIDPLLSTSPDPDAVAHELICNLIREYDRIKFVNIGHVVRSMSRRVDTGGRRGVYVAHFRSHKSRHDDLHIIRFQKWGVRERLDEGKPMLQAMLESEEYTDYILDRRLASRQLGMKVAARLWVRKIQEVYNGTQQQYAGATIWTPYIERNYISGIATDKVPRARLTDPEYARRLADKLGRAAATNLIVGRANPAGMVVFDDGDEFIVENATGMIRKIVVADPTGTFKNFERDLSLDAPFYADPIRRRCASMPNIEAFARSYIGAFVEQFVSTQEKYERGRKHFDELFSFRRTTQEGSFVDRWEKVLRRMRNSDARTLAEIIIGHTGLAVSI